MPYPNPTIILLAGLPTGGQDHRRHPQGPVPRSSPTTTRCTHTQTLEHNLAAATAINAATQEAVDLVHNEASRTRFDVPEPAPGS